MKMSSGPIDAEVVVVGGGPAGSTAARCLAGEGHDVVLLERSAAFPRSKPCGESLSPGAVEELRGLGVLDRVLALPHTRVEGWKIHPHAGAPFVGRFPARTFGICLDRALYDEALLDEARDAGVRVVFGRKATDVILAGESVVGVRLQDGAEARARLLIGADGLRSVVNRRLGFLQRPPRLHKLALTAHVTSAAANLKMGELHLHSWGCVGIAPIDGSMANVALVLNRCESASVRGAPSRYFDERLRTLTYLADANRVADVMATGPFDFPTKRIVTDGALVVGDAAGYYDPFTGQGIYRALRGGRAAARTAHVALRSGDTSARALGAYERSHRRLFDPSIRLQRVIEFAIERPRLFSVAAALLRFRPPLADTFVAVTGDLLPIRSLFLPAAAEGVS